MKPRLRGAADRGFAAGRDPERRMRLLRRRRLDHDVVELPEFSAVREALARRERLGHHLDRFLEPRLGLLRWNAEAGELVVPVALADAEIEPAAGDQIERRRLLGQQHRIVPGQHDDGGAKPQRGGAHGERGLQHQGGGDLVPAGEMVLDQEARAIAQRLGLDRVVEIVAEALPGFRAEVLGAGLRRAENSELHAGSVLKIRGRGLRSHETRIAGQILPPIAKIARRQQRHRQRDAHAMPGRDAESFACARQKRRHCETPSAASSARSGRRIERRESPLPAVRHDRWRRHRRIRTQSSPS